MGKCTICQRPCDGEFFAKLGEKWPPVCRECARKLRSQGILITGVVKSGGGALTDGDVLEAIAGLQKKLGF
ncbi:MAG: hypothetical protein J7J17_00605 [Hadesarchaea archaeon]|nr:hypothetical protein [Hadesarchaea archaeon]